MSTPAERKSALSDSKDLFNGFAALFNPVAKRIFAIPELRPVLALFQAMADAAAPAKRAALDSAIVAAGGLDPVPPLTPAETARAKQMTDAITQQMQSFELETGLEIMAISVERSSDGKIHAGDVTLLR